MNWCIIFSGKRKQKKQIISVHNFFSVANFYVPCIVLHNFLFFFPILCCRCFFVSFPSLISFHMEQTISIVENHKEREENEVSLKSEPSEAFGLLQFTWAVTDPCIWWMPTTHSPKYQHQVNLVAVDGRNLVLLMWFLAEEGLAREKTWEAEKHRAQPFSCFFCARKSSHSRSYLWWFVTTNKVI